MRQPFHERAKEKAEKSKHYATARNHMVSAGGYFAMFLATVVVDHMVEEWNARKSDKADETTSEPKDRPSLFDRFLAGM